jgi:hypothetical protein
VISFHHKDTKDGTPEGVLGGYNYRELKIEN